MRIVLIIASKGYGGLERHVVDLANELTKQHDVFLIGDESFKTKLNANVQLIAFAADTWRFNPVALWRLRRTLLKLSPDIIHAQANKAAKMVGLCGNLSATTIATIHNQKHDTSPFNSFDGVIAVSRASTQLLMHPNSVVIENGIPPTATIPKTRIEQLHTEWVPTQEPLTIAVGRLVEAKGFDILLHAWSDLPNKLVIVGTGQDELKLKRMQKKLNLGDRVTFAGFREDVSDLMQAANLLVISSRREGFPYVLVEALHAGIPIVSTDIPGAREFLPPEAVAPREDIIALRKALKRALSNWQKLPSQYAPYHEHARSVLTLEHMTTETVAFYKRTLLDNHVKVG